MLRNYSRPKVTKRTQWPKAMCNTEYNQDFKTNQSSNEGHYWNNCDNLNEECRLSNNIILALIFWFQIVLLWLGKFHPGKFSSVYLNEMESKASQVYLCGTISRDYWYVGQQLKRRDMPCMGWHHPAGWEPKWKRFEEEASVYGSKPLFFVSEFSTSPVYNQPFLDYTVLIV